MACDCVKRTNETMRAEHNTEIIFNLFPPHQMIVATQVREKKRGARAVTLVATYCPLCGVKYDQEGAG